MILGKRWATLVIHMETTCVHEELTEIVEHIMNVERAYVHMDYAKEKTNLHRASGGFS